MTSAPAISATSVAKRYGRTLAVDGITLSVAAGETLGVLGPNGAGKTTLVEMIAGIRKPDQGSVSVLGLDPRRERAQVRQVLGVQLQDAYLHHALSTEELIDLYRSFYSDPRGTEETLDLVELGTKRGTRFEKLSGGQQQRLSVALALVGKPRVVVLDELTTGLDPTARRRMWRAIARLREDGVTILLVSHAMDEVERLCDRIVVVQAGRIVAEGTAEQICAAAGAPTLEDAFVALTGEALHHDEEDE